MSFFTLTCIFISASRVWELVSLVGLVLPSAQPVYTSCLVECLSVKFTVFTRWSDNSGGHAAAEIRAAYANIDVKK